MEVTWILAENEGHVAFGRKLRSRGFWPKMKVSWLFAENEGRVAFGRK
jgi:hypothetical protein